MQKMKKLSLLLAAIITLSLGSTACDGLPTPNSTENSTQTESSFSGSFKEESESDLEESFAQDSNSEETSDSVEDSAEDVIDEELLIMWQTVDLAYDLSWGETLGSYTLTGTITNIRSGSKYNADLLVEVREDFPIYLYNLQGETSALQDGDSITV